MHRDLKPTNILLSSNGTPKVSDLGLAHISELTSITSRGVLVGTLKYMSPEMFRTEPISPASDVYQLGLIFYELLTGSAAHRVTAATEMISAILDQHPVSPSTLVPELSEDLAVLVELCLSKDPRIRPQNGMELCRLLGEMESEGRLLPNVTSAPAGIPLTRLKAEPPPERAPAPESMGDTLGPPIDVMTDEVAGLVFSQKKVLDRLRVLCGEGPYLLWRVVAHRTLESLGFAHYTMQLKMKPESEGAPPEHPELEFTVVVARDPQGRLRIVHMGPPVARA